MQGLTILFSALAWLVWWGGLVFLIQMDQKTLGNAERMNVTPYVVVGLVCGVLLLPVYFWKTRRTRAAALRGLGIALGLAVVAIFIAFVGTLIPS